MLQKIKNWLIKKLGGYTEAEYKDPARFPITRVHFEPVKTGNVERLSAEYTYDDHYFGVVDVGEVAMRRLKYDLAEKLGPFVRWEESEDPVRMKRTLRGTVNVVRWRDTVL